MKDTEAIEDIADKIETDRYLFEKESDCLGELDGK
jgi:hypothetical protein